MKNRIVLFILACVLAACAATRAETLPSANEITGVSQLLVDCYIQEPSQPRNQHPSGTEMAEADRAWEQWEEAVCRRFNENVESQARGWTCRLKTPTEDQERSCCGQRWEGDRYSFSVALEKNGRRYQGWILSVHDRIGNYEVCDWPKDGTCKHKE